MIETLKYKSKKFVLGCWDVTKFWSIVALVWVILFFGSILLNNIPKICHTVIATPCAYVVDNGVSGILGPCFNAFGHVLTAIIYGRNGSPLDKHKDSINNADSVIHTDDGGIILPDNFQF